MQQTYARQDNVYRLFSHRLLNHQNQLSIQWRKAYKQIFPEDDELIVSKLDEINFRSLREFLEGQELNFCDQYISGDNVELSSMGITQTKIILAIRLYLKVARTLLREQSLQQNNIKEVWIILEHLQSMEMMIMFKAFSYIETKDFERLANIFDKGLADKELEQFFHELLSNMIKITQANGGKILLVDQQPEILRMVAYTDQDQPLLNGEIQSVLKSGQPQFLELPLYDQYNEIDQAKTNEIANIWFLPIKIKQQAIGVVVLYFKRRHTCHVQEREILELLIDRASITISRAMMIDTIRTDEQRIRALTERIIMVQNEESRRIARELHDETSGSLQVINIYLEQIYKELSRTQLTTRKKVKEAIALINRTVQDVRRLISDLGPVMLDRYGLIAALQLHIKTIKEIFHTKVTLKVSKQFPKLPRTVEVVIYRSIQEALNNITRHAQASKANIDIKYRQEMVTINIKDNGIGFDTKEMANKGDRPSFGLLGMQERVALLGGTIAIKSELNKGTEISITLPTIVS